MTIRKVPAKAWRAACEKTTQPLGFVNTENEMMWINAAWERWWGYTRPEVVGRTWMEFTVTEDVGHDLACVNEVIRGERSEYFCPKSYRHKMGHRLPFELGVFRYPEMGNLTCFIVQAVQEPHGKEDPAMMEAIRRELKADIEELRLQYERHEQRQQALIEARKANAAVIEWLQKWGWLLMGGVGLLGWLIDFAKSAQ